jgi:hypothetical protein
MSTPISTLCPPKLMWLLKSSLDQKLIMIYYKFNDDFKSYNNFSGHKVDMRVDIYNYSLRAIA